MKPIHPASALRPLLRTGLAGLLCLLLARCGNYQMTTPVSASQSTPRLTGYPTLSGKPALRTPAAIGILTTGRTHALDLHQAKLDPATRASIRSIQPLDSFLPGREYYQLSDVLTKRPKWIHDLRFLGLDVILVCDQDSSAGEGSSLVEAATLGMLDLGLRKQSTQLTVVCIDARTGYVYGSMGRREDGHTPRLAVFDANVLGDPSRSHLVRTTRREAVKEFPAFWQEVVAQYGRR